MQTVEDRENVFARDTYQRIRDLCRPPGMSKAGSKVLISDKDIEELAQCLRDLKEDEASERPRTYAILHMVGRQDLLPVFVAKGLRDNSFPYPDRRSLPPRMSKYEPDACHLFLDLQGYVMSPALELEKQGESPHVMAESGDIFLQHLERLGRGGDAKVDKVRSKITGKIYARKKMYRHKDFNRNKEIHDRFINEVQILKKLDHDHLVTIVGSYSDARSVAIIMIPVADMDLKQYLRSRNTQLHGQERSLFRTYYGCLAGAIDYLHANNIRHKDIKPNNILLARDNIYITDFGTAIEFDGDQSVTKGTVRVKTNQYQSPEVARGSPRGTASDIWSLGVTFLEMTTVLRSESLESMQKFLDEHGSTEPYVYENIDGAMQWADYLSKNTKLPRTDNAPMQWIKDMLEKRSSDRPSAEQLFHSIKQAHDGVFCCKRCQEDGSTMSETSSDEGEEEDDTIRPELGSDVVAVSEPLQTATYSKQRSTQEISPDPFPSTQHPRTSSLQQQVNRIFRYLPNFSMPSLTPHRTPPMPVKQDPIQATVIPPEVKQYISTQTWDPYDFKLPGSFPDPDIDHGDPLFPEETSPAIMADYKGLGAEDGRLDSSLHHRQPGSILVTPYTRVLGNPSINNQNYSRTLTGPVAYSYPVQTETPLPEIGVNVPDDEDLASMCPKNGHGFHPDIDKAFGLPEVYDNPAVEGHIDVSDVLLDPQFHNGVSHESPGSVSSATEKIPDDACLFNPGSCGFILKIPAPSNKSYEILRSLLGQPSERCLKRSRSDENIEIQRQTEIILDDTSLVHDENHYYSTRRRSSHSFQLEDNGNYSRTAVTANLLEFKQQLHKLIMPSESSTTQRTDVASEPVLPTGSDQVFGGEIVQEPTRLPEGSLPYEGVPESTIVHLQKAVNPRRNTPPGPPKTNPLLSFFTNARAPRSYPKSTGPNRLTGDNLSRLNSEILEDDIKGNQRRKSHPRFRVERASVYMKKVFDDTASSVPTSVMSTATRQKFKHAGLMLPSQDRTLNYLGTYTALGKADAVRVLLKAGCCPGTKDRPRPGPIFNVVRGASSRHIKCLRALIKHNVNVNVRQNGKTPLIEAVEQEAWSGYVTVIYLLLMAGANPNAKDGSGDSPLLKLLGGGLHPLDDHHRKALALLLSPSWTTSVEVTPLGTQNKPLHLAIRRNDPYAVGMLLEKDDSVIEAENSEGLTPLLLAARSWMFDMSSDQLEILDLLLEKKADPNAKMLRSGKTPLHIAASYGLVDAVERLLEFGADPKRRTRDGKSVFDIADERKASHGCKGCADCTDLKDLLKAHSGG